MYRIVHWWWKVKHNKLGNHRKGKKRNKTRGVKRKKENSVKKRSVRKEKIV